MRYLFAILGCVACANNTPSVDGGGVDGGSACVPIEARAASCSGGGCIDEIVRDCAVLSDIVNDSFETAFGTCLATDAPLGECLLEGRGGVTPTDAARSFATAFCANCVTSITPAACEVNFFDEDSPQTGVAGTLILPLTDPLATEATTRCTDGASCGDDIRDCIEGVMADNGVRGATATCLATAFLNGEVSGCTTPDVDAGLDAGLDAGADSGTDGGVCIDSHEPNETRSNTFGLGNVSDRGSYPQDTEVAAITDDTDVDWYEYTVEDAIGGTVGPRADYRGPDELCMYWECAGDPGSVECEEGTASTLEGLDGCCTSSRVKLIPDCPGFDDSGTVFLVVEPNGMPMCAGYEFDWGDD